MDDDAPAWYGKLSSLGDFAHRRMSPQLLDLCDTWLSRAIADSREQLGAGWLDVYLSAPLWRFAWAPGVVDERWWFGVLMPSCDNVGRYFPLIMLESRQAPPTDTLALDQLELRYERLARAAMLTLDSRASLDDLDRALHELAPWASARSDPPSHAASLAACMHTMAVQQVLEQLAGQSIWWRGPDMPGAPMSLHGLPEGEDFVALLRGVGMTT